MNTPLSAVARCPLLMFGWLAATLRVRPALAPDTAKLGCWPADRAFAAFVAPRFEVGATNIEIVLEPFAK